MNSSIVTVHNPIIIAGIIAIALIFFALSLWLGFRIYRKRATAKRESKMGAAFLSVKGLVQDDGSGDEKHGDLTSVYIFNPSDLDETDINDDLVHSPFLDGRKH